MKQYTYEDFVREANEAGRFGEFSQTDLTLAQKAPEFGRTLLSYKQDYHNATTPEEKALAQAGADRARSSYGAYTTRPDGSGYYSDGKIPSQINDTLDKLAEYGPFSFDRERPNYESDYTKLQGKMLDDILNREEFSWSKETDPQWGSYKKSYLREGERATADALGKASAASGGRGSSYAVGAASQAGDYYAAKLNDVLPQLYQQAYDKYLKDYQMKLNDFQMVSGLEQTDYSRYLDSLGQYNTDRSFALGQHQAGLSQLQSLLGAQQGQGELDYGKYLDKVSLEQARQQQAQQQQAQQQALLQAQVDAMLGVGARPSDDMVAGSGYSGEYIQAMADAWQREQAAQAALSGAGTGGGLRGTGGLGYDNGDRTPEEIKRMQEALGVTADGYWGPATREAAKGKSADEVWNDMMKHPGAGIPDGNFTGVRRAINDAMHAGEMEKALNFASEVWPNLSEDQRILLEDFFRGRGYELSFGE